MRFLRLAFISLAFVCAAPIPLFAAEAHYVASAELPPQLLPPPPSEGSAGWKKNIEGVLAAQKHVGKGDLAAMRDEQHVRLGLMTDVVGPDFTREKFPRAYLLLDRVFEDSENIAHADKQFWHTRRPYLTDKHVRLLIDRIDQSPAYPSGHTSFSRVVAEVLGLLYPDRLADLRARADAIAYHRIEAGVHYPGDVEGGRLLAMLVVGALMKNDDFQSDLAAAREEIGR
jgi:acid phosphatase (class A)